MAGVLALQALQGDILLPSHSEDICVSAHVSKSADFGRTIVIFPFVTVLGGIVQRCRLSQGARVGGGPGPSALPQKRLIVDEVHCWQIAPCVPLDPVFLVLPEGSSGLAQLTGLTDQLKSRSLQTFHDFRMPLIPFLTWTREGDRRFTGVESSNTDVVQRRKNVAINYPGPNCTPLKGKTEGGEEESAFH